VDRRTFLALSVLGASTTLWGEMDEVDLGSSIGSGSRIVSSILRKLSLVQDHVGYVQFNIISFDEMLNVASRCKKPFNSSEIAYIESIFYGDPRKYGFYGERTVTGLSTAISKKDVIYMDKTGHFLMKGAALEKFSQIKRLVGNDLILTSGVRAPVKQLYLFLKKMENSRGDLRLAGKEGYGHFNFTEKFQETDVFKKLYDGGHICIRYTQRNPYGVRFEPWHIKVTGGHETA
jgi:hypothetical protein